MKKLFIPLYRKINLKYIKKELDKLPSNILIAYSIQYKPLALMIKKYLRKEKTIQIFGCSDIKNKNPIFLISDGNFHAMNLALNNDVYYFDINKKKIRRIDKREIEKTKNKKKGYFLKYLNSRSIGILVSIKPGQNNIKEAIKLKKKIDKKGKKSYILIGDSINKEELENFQIDSYINTACPRLDFLDFKSYDF